MANEDRKELFSVMVSAGTRTYFFDVKESKEGVRYFVISESRQTDSGHEHHRVMVFEEHVEQFCQGLEQALAYLGARPRPHSIDEIRREHPKAYEKWTVDDDNNLRQMYREGRDIAGLAAKFQRKPGAIRARLTKLGLLQPER